jgi:hypothetical protein
VLPGKTKKKMAIKTPRNFEKEGYSKNTPTKVGMNFGI